jgi:hypothetical protein
MRSRSLAMKRRDCFLGMEKRDRPLRLFNGRRAIALFASKGRSPLLMNSQLALRSILTLVPPFLRGVRGDQASTITLNKTQQLPTNPLKTLQHLNIRKPNNLQSIPL